MELQIKERRWGWLGHTTKQALGFGMESTEEAEAKEAKEHLATVNGGVDGRGGLTQGQESHSHDQWRGRWERQALLKAKEQLATVNGGVDKRGSLHSRPRNG